MHGWDSLSDSRLKTITKFKRCKVCVDATGELADFSAGDAWIDRFLTDKAQWSLLLIRSRKAEKIIADMKLEGLINEQKVSIEEIIRSQSGNLTSKKIRQTSRLKILSIFGTKVPDFDGGYYKKESGMMFETKVFLSQSFFHFLEKIGLYKLFSKLIRRFPDVKKH